MLPIDPSHNDPIIRNEMMRTYRPKKARRRGEEDCDLVVGHGGGGDDQRIVCQYCITYHRDCHNYKFYLFEATSISYNEFFKLSMLSSQISRQGVKQVVRSLSGTRQPSVPMVRGIVVLALCSGFEKYFDPLSDFLLLLGCFPDCTLLGYRSFPEGRWSGQNLQ